MHKLYHQIDLQDYHTFHTPHRAQGLFAFTEAQELIKFLATQKDKYKKLMPIGSGSNLLFKQDYDGCLLHLKNDTIKVVEETGDFAIIQTGGGLEWDDFVAWTVLHQYFGLENLSLIPGTTGATPVQNIGAYGTEVSEFIVKAEAISLQDGHQKNFSSEACQFAYRNSIFKHELRNQYLITKVYYKLYKKPHFNLDYGSVKKEVQNLGEINQKNIRQAIMNIRNAKLPDTARTGNAGSFFKNPVVSKKFAEQLAARHPDMPQYNISNNNIKLAAGWLIDQCGLKGYTNDQGAGVHNKQALVLINKGVPNGMEIVKLAEFIKNKVYEKFQIILEPEVTIL